MPPKKKNASKKSGKKGKKEITVEEIVIDEPELNKEFFVLHIKDLERKLRLYKEKENKLQSENDEFMKKEKETSQEKHDLIAFLKKNLMNRGDEMSDLKMRYNGLQQMKEVEKGKYDARLQEIRTELVDTKDRLTTQNNILNAKLEALEKFKQEKEKYLQEYTELEKVLSDKKEEHQQILESILGKQSHDRDRLKKEIVSKINLVAAEFRKISQKQTSETTKRTIRENVSIRTQLAKMDDRNIELMQENQQMRVKVKENIKRMKDLDHSHKELASKNSSHIKLLHLLTMKHEEHQEIVNSYQREMNIILLIQEENEKMKLEIESRNEAIEILKAANDVLKESISSIMEEINDIKQKTNEARSALIESVHHLKELLQSKSKGASTSSAKSTQSSISKTSISVSNNMSLAELKEWGDIQQRTLADEKLRKLLDALDYEENSRVSSANGFEKKRSSCPPSPSISISLRDTITKRSLTPIDVIETDKKSSKILSDFEIRRQARIFSAQQKKGYCVPGVLQTVPPMSRHIPTNLEKTRELNKKLIGLTKYNNESDFDKLIKFSTTGPLSDARARFLADKVSGY